MEKERRALSTSSASVGIQVDLDDDVAFVANVTRSYRPPALEQLYNFGPHIGNLVFVGGDLGIVDAPTLARKIRSITALAETRVVASVPRGQLGSAQADGVYDAVIARSFVSEIFEDQFERLTVRPDQLATALERVHPRFRQGLVTAIEQVFGMALATEIKALDSATAPETGDEMLASTIDLVLPHHGLTLAFELLVRTTDAVDLAARMTSQAVGDVTETDRDSAVAEISNMIVGRLHNKLTERGVTGRITLPSADIRTARRASADDRPTTVHFRCVDGRPELWLHVVATHYGSATDKEQAT